MPADTLTTLDPARERLYMVTTDTMTLCMLWDWRI